MKDEHSLPEDAADVGPAWAVVERALNDGTFTPELLIAATLEGGAPPHLWPLLDQYRLTHRLSKRRREELSRRDQRRSAIRAAVFDWLLDQARGIKGTLEQRAAQAHVHPRTLQRERARLSPKK